MSDIPLRGRENIIIKKSYSKSYDPFYSVMKKIVFFCFSKNFVKITMVTLSI